MSAENWLSPVQLLDTSIIGLSLEVNQEFPGGDSSVTFTLNTRFDDIEEQDDLFLCRGMIEGIQVAAAADDAETVLYKVGCNVGILVGIQKEAVPEDVSDDDLKRYLELNALSLGYAKVRTTIESITAESIIKKVTIPAIDPQVYMELIAAKREQTAVEE